MTAFHYATPVLIFCYEVVKTPSLCVTGHTRALVRVSRNVYWVIGQVDRGIDASCAVGARSAGTLVNVYVAVASRLAEARLGGALTHGALGSILGNEIVSANPVGVPR